MKILATSLFLVVSAFAQDAKPFLGRWDITVTPAQGAPYAGWMELTQMAGKLEGRYQPRGGEWKPFSAATLENGSLVATLAPAGAGPAFRDDRGAPEIPRRGQAVRLVASLPRTTSA